MEEVMVEGGRRDGGGDGGRREEWVGIKGVRLMVED